MNTQASQIHFTYKDVPYTLEYDRNSIVQLEQAGLEINEFLKKPLVNTDLIFKGAFLKHHRNTKESIINEIYDNLNNRNELIGKLVVMIDDCYSTLLDDTENKEGNITWDTTGLN